MTFEFDEYDRSHGLFFYGFMSQFLYPLAIFLLFMLFIDWMEPFSIFYKVTYVIVSVISLYYLMELIKYLCMRVLKSKKHYSLMVGERIELRQGDQVIGTAPIDSVYAVITASKKYWFMIQLEDGSLFPKMRPIKTPNHGSDFIESIAQEIHRHVKFTTVIEQGDETEHIKKYTDFSDIYGNKKHGNVKIWLKGSSALELDHKDVARG